ncbi:MAG: hypothetical protein KC493_01755 [Bacteriovoracaceae bacterium]|nr:hypothetical protein [Bacteriovoracaceae bacterium]
MVNKISKISVLFTLLLFARVTYGLTRIQPTLGKVGDIIYSNSPTDLKKIDTINDQVSFTQVLLLKNDSIEQTHDLVLENARLLVYDKVMPVLCQHASESKTSFPISPGSYLKIKCLVQVKSGDDARFKTQDAIATLRIPLGESGAIRIPIRIRIGDFK